MKPWFWMVLAAMGLVVAGCPTSSGSDDDDSSDDDDAADDDDTAFDDDDTSQPDDDDFTPPPGDDDDSADGLVFFSGFVLEPQSGQGIPNATATALQDTSFTAVTDSTGGYGLEVWKLSEVDIQVTAAGYVPSTVMALAGVNQDPSNGVMHIMLDTNFFPQLAATVGAQHDTSAGLLLVSIVDGVGESVGGVQVSIDADNDGSFVLGQGQPQPGDTITTEGATVGFVNTAPGDATVTFTPPANTTCLGRDTATVRADEVVAITYVCS